VETKQLPLNEGDERIHRGSGGEEGRIRRGGEGSKSDLSSSEPSQMETDDECDDYEEDEEDDDEWGAILPGQVTHV